MTDRTAQYWNEWMPVWSLWAGVFSGPVGWALDVGISYAVVPWACEMNHPNLLHLFSALGLALVVAGAFVSYRCLASLPRESNTDGGHAVDRSRFLAVLGLAMNALFLLVVLANAVPRFILSPCHQ
jgi:hypothetical protein